MSGDHNRYAFDQYWNPDMRAADDYQVGGNHYKSMAVEPWTLMAHILSPEEFRGFLKGNAIKYAMRQGTKPDSDDSAKLMHYLQKLQEFDEQFY